MRPTQGAEKWIALSNALYGSAALPFVIPSEAEGSAVSLHPKLMPTTPGGWGSGG
jgi:hypothetical protein